MFSPNSLYDYLRWFLYTNKKPTIVRTFEKHGSLNLLSLTNNSNISNNISPYINSPNNIVSSMPYKYLGYCQTFDQDPINLQSIYRESTSKQAQQQYINQHADPYKEDISKSLYLLNQLTTPVDFISKFSSAVHVPLVCHSEKNSNDLNILCDNYFIPVHYWYHAYISLFWFSQYEHLATNHYISPYKFGLYARDMSGTRHYRLSLLEKIANINNSVSFTFQEPMFSQVRQHNPDLLNIWDSANLDNDSNSSAEIEWTDIYKFDIQIVAETLFDTEKTHLTEKIFKPIAMGQPYIIVSGPNSLKYIKQYGFKTFNSIWDESYDEELNSQPRLEKLTRLIHYINNLPTDQYNALMKKCKEITKYNRNYFFSNKFKQVLLSELHNNLLDATEQQKEQFYKLPGGTWFLMLDKLYSQNPNLHINRKLNRDIVNYIKLRHFHVATQIIKKYPNLI